MALLMVYKWFTNALKSSYKPLINRFKVNGLWIIPLAGLYPFCLVIIPLIKPKCLISGPTRQTYFWQHGKMNSVLINSLELIYKHYDRNLLTINPLVTIYKPFIKSVVGGTTS